MFIKVNGKTRKQSRFLTIIQTETTVPSPG